MQKNILTMYMVTHKSVNYIPMGRTAIFVGNGINSNGFLRDNTGINIASKNANYCELTALYWVWKNDKNSEYVSFEHYRRFFMKRKTLCPHPYSSEEMIKDLKKYDALLIRPSRSTLSIAEYYCKIHNKNDFELMKAAITLYYPDYIMDFDKFMDGNESSLFNMCALKKEKFNDYCEWLFKILSYVENNINFEGRSQYQKRAFGFMAERLLNVWIIHNCHNVKYFDVYYYENNRLYSFCKSLKHEKVSVYNPISLG